jgi:XTP/dITP diphosphohydrolase
LLKIVIATRNPGKIREIEDVLRAPGSQLLTFRDLPGLPEPEESGQTLEENAVIKAVAAREHAGLPALSDDSGLLVDALGGNPGVHSSRYAGPEGDAERNMDRLLSEMKDVPHELRTARFLCVVALALPDGVTLLSKGECGGRILTERRGTGGFGYDPIFQPDGFERSMAELTLEEKNEISHRGKALRAMKALLKNL